MQLLSAYDETDRERERGDAMLDLVPLDEALRWSSCWSSRDAAGQQAAAGWRGRAGAAGKLRGREGGGMCCRGAVEARDALVCSVCTVDSNTAIDAGWGLGRLDLGLNLGFDHVDHGTQTH